MVLLRTIKGLNINYRYQGLSVITLVPCIYIMCLYISWKIKFQIITVYFPLFIVVWFGFFFFLKMRETWTRPLTISAFFGLRIWTFDILKLNLFDGVTSRLFLRFITTFWLWNHPRYAFFTRGHDTLSILTMVCKYWHQFFKWWSYIFW